ncbi:hypothetical protein Adt_05601 [Abeliophyllum distichum]|uniref:Uncharacterized protein n=1 Tax=Abeliophyllum distichum TaxID=126358 RepID=A0ABD1V6M9_9LAMI
MDLMGWDTKGKKVNKNRKQMEWGGINEESHKGMTDGNGEYCKENSSEVEYPLRLKLIGLHIEDVSFATDQTERHLEVGNTGYENYDSSAKRHLLVSLGLFLRIYYKGGMLGEQSASLFRTSVLTEE